MLRSSAVNTRILDICPGNRNHDRESHRISILHFESNEADIDRFIDVTDVKIQNLFDVNFDVYHHNHVS